MNKFKWWIKYRLLRPSNMFRDIKWWIKHRTTDKYHIVKLGLPPGYYDIDHRMLYACFALLVEFVEYEYNNADWEWDEEHQKVGKEIKELYNWWTNIRPNREILPCYGTEYVDDDIQLVRLIKIREYLWT